MPNWCDAQIVEKKIWTDGLFTLTIKSDEVQAFEPGQFLHLALLDENESRINRPYSVASPHGTELEFFIVLVEDGKLTPRLWKLEVGDTVQVSDKAAGRFTLEHTPASESLWLIATGTGLAPYIAMLRDPKIWNSYSEIVVMHGVRYHADLAYVDELKCWADDADKCFHYVPALTRESVEGIPHGRLPGLIESGYAEDVTGSTISAEATSIMLCGNPAMLESMLAVLETKGLKEHRRKFPGQVVLERYW